MVKKDNFKTSQETLNHNISSVEHCWKWDDYITSVLKHISDI